MKRLFFSMLLAAMILLLCGAALAQEEIQALDLDLFSQGGLPDVHPVPYALRDNFDAYVYDQMMQQSASIDVRTYGMDSETLRLRLQNLINNSPKLFFVSNAFQVASNSSGKILRLIPSYLYSGEDLKNRMAAFEASVAEIAALAGGASTDLGKLLLLNDYFCVNFEYDRSLSIFGPDQLLSGGKGVCQAYMLALSAVLDELDIPRTHATSHAMKHTWNIVELDGSWYHLDVTWNDPAYPLCAGHNYFLLSDAEMENSGHYGWSSENACFDTRYDSRFWRSINTPLGVSGNEVYYLDPEISLGMRTLRCMDLASGNSRAVHSFSILDDNNSITTYSGFDPVSAGEGRIFYAARGRLHSVSPNGNHVSFIYSSGDNRQIWSCWYSGGSVFMLVGDSPHRNTKVIRCDADQLIALSASPAVVRLAPGESRQIKPVFPAEIPETSLLSWASSSNAVTVNANGLVRAAAPGTALVHIGARNYEGAEALVAIIVEGARELKLPAALKEIKAEAFIGTDAEIIELPEGVLTIGARAFAGCKDLVLAILPDSLESIADDAFANNSDIIIVCSEGSQAQTYARKNGLRCILAS